MGGHLCCEGAFGLFGVVSWWIWSVWGSVLILLDPNVVNKLQDFVSCGVFSM